LLESYSEPENNYGNYTALKASESAKENDQPNIVTGTGDENSESWQSRESQVAGRLTGTMEDLERIQETEFIMSEEVRECIQDCVDCYRTCSQTLIRCLNIGGKHAEVEHVNLIMDCAKICSATADFMLRNSLYYPQTCGLTADICDECGDVCARFEEDFMKECASVCRRCAESCREMAR
jgi:hypothetical protein